MNIPTICTNCETSEGVRFQCKGCNFAKFCSRDCQKKCWKKHKRYCMPLNDAVNDSIERARPLLKNKNRIDDEESHCMFCLEGGTSEDPLFHSGCGCRPDSGMSIGHIKCFQEFARASFADEKKRKGYVHCCVGICSNCSQDRVGIIPFEMELILWKLYDPDCLTQKNVQGIDNKRAFFMRDSLQCLDAALNETNVYSNDLILYCRLRILYLRKNVRKQIEFNEYDRINEDITEDFKIDRINEDITEDFKIDRINEDITEDFKIGNNLIKIKKYQAAIDFNRRNYEKVLLNITRYPQLKRLCYGVLYNYARSLFEAFQESSQNSNGANDPPYHYLEEAERLMREENLANRDNIGVYVENTFLLCQILICQRKIAEANQIPYPCLQKTQRILGPSHELTKSLLAMNEKIRPYT